MCKRSLFGFPTAVCCFELQHHLIRTPTTSEIETVNEGHSECSRDSERGGNKVSTAVNEGTTSEIETMNAVAAR